jgi:hypothetical protein
MAHNIRPVLPAEAVFGNDRLTLRVLHLEVAVNGHFRSIDRTDRETSPRAAST